MKRHIAAFALAATTTGILVTGAAVAINENDSDITVSVRPASFDPNAPVFGEAFCEALDFYGGVDGLLEAMGDFYLQMEDEFRVAAQEDC